MLDNKISKISKVELDKTTALDQLGEFLLKSSKTNFDEDKLTSILPAVYSFCNEKFKSTGGLKTIIYSTFSGEDEEECCAFALRNNISVNRHRYMSSKLDIFERYEILNSLIHEHRHVGDYYDENLKSNSTRQNKEHSYISNAEYYISDFIENWCSFENPNFKGDSQTRKDAEELKSFIYEKYVLDRSEISARCEALNGLGEILNHLKTKHLSPIEKFRMHLLKNTHNQRRETEIGFMTIEATKLSDDVMKEYRNYIEHSIYTELPELTNERIKTEKEDKSSARFRKLFDIDDKTSTLAKYIIVGLNLQYDEKLANDFFDLYMKHSNRSIILNNNNFSSLINRTEFIPNEEQLDQISRYVLNCSNSSQEALAYCMEHFISLSPEYLIESFMRVDENFDETINSYESEFMPIESFDKEMLILKHNLKNDNSNESDENFNEYIESIFSKDETMDLK